MTHPEQKDPNLQKNPLETWREGWNESQIQQKIDTLSKEETMTEEEVRQIARDIIDMRLLPEQIATMLQSLPLAQRMKIEQQIITEQQEQIATMSQKQYRDYLNAVFPRWVPTNVAETAWSMIADAGEIYRQTREQIENTATSLPWPEIADDRRDAHVAAANAETQANELWNQLDEAPEQARKKLSAEHPRL